MSTSWFQHALRRTGWRPQNQAVALGVLGVIMGLILGGVYLSQVASFATTNRQIEALIAERDRLERTNEQLRAEIASLETVPRLLARSQELGFRPALATDIEYLVVEGYNPNRGETVIELEANDDELIPVYDETFSGWLQQQVDSLTQQFNEFGN